MKFSKVRLFQILKISALIFLVAVLFLVANKKTRSRIFPYFSTRCLEYRQADVSRKLNDRIVDYSAEVKRKGIRVCNDETDLKERISSGNLVRVKSRNAYVVDRMTYSSPYLTPESKALLDEIAERFREKASQKGLKGARFIVTSMTRMTKNIKSLRKNNRNSSEDSPHLYGNAFDISYKTITARKWMLTNCDRKFLKDSLGEVIWQLRSEKKCWATYERMQNCFHVVAR